MSPKLPVVTAAELLRALERDGWVTARQQGSHRTLVHPTKPGVVVIPMHKSADLPIGLLARLLKNALLSADDLRRLL